MNSRMFRFRYLTTQALNSAAAETSRIRGHQVAVRLFDEAIWERFHAGARQAFPTLYREGRHTAYGLVYTCATRPLIDPNTVLQLLTGER